MSPKFLFLVRSVRLHYLNYFILSHPKVYHLPTVLLSYSIYVFITAPYPCLSLSSDLIADESIQSFIISLIAQKMAKIEFINGLAGN